ncbi:YscO family type III secretion system apparatus protein [Bradyrhizobium sp. CB3481]|uniref:type III secretion system stalk subunit SctO n=1 Tax=Bradyrhizobium sp. CB3481 TaxID=3039158 RepID=UPI0024B253A2|nr:YscO family type III secretion system apparatus protein [Bradyrhizobium sp. CB3481]WFU14887.1 YscO family type III secretion system apparatus protein [Bradyrhizobium sp. CB3481]
MRESALDNAVAAVDVARTNLRKWQQHRRRLEGVLYQSLIGETVSLNELVRLKEKIIALHEHQQLLEGCIEKALAVADPARQACEDAYNAVREAYKQFDKCEHLLRAFDSSTAGEE